jgi:hypothetical protein
MTTIADILRGMPQAARTVGSLLGNTQAGQSVKSALSDYGQLFEKDRPLAQDYELLKGKVNKHIPPNEAFKDPQAMGEWSLAAALNAPMGLGLKATKFSKAHAKAQKNAALPVEQGGLGLPPNNTAMDRAKAMGFDVDNDLFHGTSGDIKKFSNSKRGKNTSDITPASNVAHWMTNDPNYANDYALYSANYDGGNANIMPLLSKTNNPLYTTENDLREALNLRGGKARLKREMDDFGQDSIEIDAPHELGVIDPKNIRSRFAAFDPMNKDSANILASILGGTALASQYNKDKKKKK